MLVGISKKKVNTCYSVDPIFWLLLNYIQKYQFILHLISDWSLTNFQFTNIHSNNVNNYMKNYQIVMKSEISSYYFKIISCTKKHFYH